MTRRNLNPQSGFITLNFILSLMIGFGMAAILFAMSMTLVVAEVTQYVTYSAARAQLGANLLPDDQIQAARNKYGVLINSNTLSPLYSNNWFEISGKSDVEVRSGVVSGSGRASFKEEYPSADGSNREVWTGVRTKFVSKVLAFRIPMLGRTADSEGLDAKIMTVLIREPSQSECQGFMKDRISKIFSLESGRYQQYGSRMSEAIAMEDNGC